MKKFLVVAAILGCLCLAATAGEAPKKKNPAAYAQIEDVPGLPRVLILGDSISIGYTLPTREALKGEANVHRPAANCGPTTRGLANIEAWLGEGRWDVIHFNWGLHDLAHHENGRAVDPPAGKNQVVIEDYKKNLEKLVQRLEKTGATLVWCTTTPVPPGANYRVVEDVAPYNAAALSVIKKHDILIDDLNRWVVDQKIPHRKPDDVHFDGDGSKKLAESVAKAIRQALKKRAETPKECTDN